MSFLRLIYWSGLLGGWSAFVAWLFCEVAFGRWVNDGFLGLTLAIVMSTLVAAAIGGGLSQAGGLVNFRWQDQILRLGLGLVGGFIGGFFGSLFGNLVFALLGWIPIIGFIGRVLGWTLMGAAVGVVEGVYDRSLKKMRNGLIGGMLGGFLGGLLFNPISFVVGSPVSSRAVAFVLLGLFVGLFVGLLQVFLKEAWVTVESGFRVGRQLILSRTETTMGTSEKAGLIFIAFGAKGVEPIHLRIVRQPDGAFVLHDNNSRAGTLLNGQRLTAPTMLHNGDVIQLGVNVVRFNERYKRADVVEVSPTPQLVAVAPAAAAPVPVAAAPAAVVNPVARVVTAPVAAARPAPPATPSATPMPKPAVLKAAPASAAKPAAPKAVEPPPPAPPPAACPVCGGTAFTSAGTSRRCKQCWAVC